MEEKKKCRVCGCSDGDCRRCIERTGHPCHWAEDDLCSACKTIVVTFASIKGGVGRTNTVILLAMCLAAAGIRVLLIDCDLNNSLSFHFIEKELLGKIKSLHIAAALSDENNNLNDFVVPTIIKGVDIIASTPYLADLRTLSEKRLKRMIPALYGKYDILIVDCAPTYDNIVLNAVNAADITITPVLKDLFSYNAASFLMGVLPRDVPNFKNWFLLINGYDDRFEDAKSGRQNDFLELYKGNFPLTPPETWLPWTNQIHLVIDYHKNLSRTKGIAGTVYNPSLHNAVAKLAGCFFQEELAVPEVF